MSTRGGQEHSDTVKSAPRARVVLVAGMSGAGRTTVQKFPADVGVEHLDTLPALIFPALIKSAVGDGHALAVGSDGHTRSGAADSILDTPSGAGYRGDCEFCVLSIDCDDVPFEGRYTETPRSHALAGDRPIADGIRRERQMSPPCTIEPTC